MLCCAADRTNLRNALYEGLGVEDVHVIYGFPLEDIRGEIRAMRKMGVLDWIYHPEARNGKE